MNKIKNSTILYVEDDKITRENISYFLQTKCRKLYIASNGEEAYTSFLNNAPDIIITDIQMPLLNGLDMAEKIKKISPKTQIIITSAYSQQEYLLKAVNLHLVQYIIKPLSIIKLNSALKDCEHFIEEKKDDKVFLKKEIFYDKIKKELIKSEQTISLSKKERALLELLITKYPSSTSYENIERFVYEFNSSKNAIKLLVKSLREKTSKELIINISGFGYKIILDLNE